MDLASLLQTLAEDAIKICKEWREEGKLHKEIRCYRKFKVEKFEYREGNIGISGSFPMIQKEEWNISDVFKLIEHVKGLDSFKRCTKHVAEEYASEHPNPEAQAEHWVSIFLQKIILDYLNEKFDNLLSYIVTFIQDLEGNPIEWNIKVWLEGIWLEIERMEIEKGIFIRKPQPEDFEYEYPLDAPFFEQHISPPSAILEIKKRVKIQPYIYPELEKIIIALQLYKMGSITRTKIFWRPKSFLQVGGISTSMHWLSKTYTYSLGERDEEKLPKFMEMIKNRLPIDETGRPLSSNPLGIALLRYQDALLKPEAIENKIAYAVMGLEALYLKAEEREGLSHKLSQRVAKILSLLDEKPIKVYNLIKEAYDIRSGFVHGSIIRKEEPKNVKKILDNVLEYLRKSILIFILLPREKEELLSLIDNAILEKQAEEKLSELIKKNAAFLLPL